jgi:AcrR family transcriptional regulator
VATDDDKRQEILKAALALADEQGLAAVTMRAVAARVGLTPMALYPRIGGKDGLLDGLVERLLGELMTTVESHQDATERLLALARAVRDLARRHPAAFSLMMARPSRTPEALRQLDAYYATLLEIGVAPRHVPRVERLLSTFALGFATSEVAGRFGTVDPRPARVKQDLQSYPAHATLRAVIERGVDWNEEYEADLADLAFLIQHRWSS